MSYQKPTVRYYVTFTVTGSGQFPLDMLRYDTCWPLEPEKVLHKPGAGTEARTILMACNRQTKDNLFTPLRWRSFGWVAKLTDVNRL